MYFFIIKNNYYDFIVTCYLILLQENLNVNTNQGPGNPVMKPQIPCLKYWPWPLVTVETVSPPRSCEGHAENVSNPCKELFSIGLLFFQWGRQIFIKINWLINSMLLGLLDAYFSAAFCRLSVWMLSKISVLMSDIFYSMSVQAW